MTGSDTLTLLLFFGGATLLCACIRLFPAIDKPYWGFRPPPPQEFDPDRYYVSANGFLQLKDESKGAEGNDEAK